MVPAAHHQRARLLNLLMGPAARLSRARLARYAAWQVKGRADGIARSTETASYAGYLSHAAVISVRGTRVAGSEAERQCGNVGRLAGVLHSRT